MRPLVVTLLMVVLLASCGADPEAGDEAVQEQATASPSFGCPARGQPSVTPVIPISVVGLLNQSTANCFAWQEFIALNWAADPSTCAADPMVQANEFGEPNPATPAQPMGPSVWETYALAEEVFLPAGAKPAAWCSASSLSDRPMELSLISKFDGHGPVEISDIGEAGTGGSWLTAQSGLLTFYSIHLNQDEFNYINDNTLYDARTQQEFAATQGINLPDASSGSSSYGTTGAIELKAAWLELDDPADWPRYKTSPALIFYPGQSEPKQAVVGLVGLHIIHKIAVAQQFIWATFEHVDNAPSAADNSLEQRDPPYTYFNPHCDPTTDYYKCKVNDPPNPGTTSSPDPYDAPVQVMREIPISSGSNNVAGLNSAVWGVIEAANPDSVFLNYELVNVLWPSQSTNVVPGQTTPLPDGVPQPNSTSQPVANTTLETYFQDLTCLSCHVDAKVASPNGGEDTLRLLPAGEESDASRLRASVEPSPAPSVTATPGLGSDYSFLFHRAEPSSP
jgi:hypothetical protein